jgi:hypothetical protein
VVGLFTAENVLALGESLGQAKRQVHGLCAAIDQEDGVQVLGDLGQQSFWEFGHGVDKHDIIGFLRMLDKVLSEGW